MTGGGVRWDDETQSWEAGDSRAPYTPPPPPLPSSPPVVPAPPPVPPTAIDPTGVGVVRTDVRRFRERITPLGAAVTVAVLAAGATAVWFQVRGGGDGHERAEQPSVSTPADGATEDSEDGGLPASEEGTTGAATGEAVPDDSASAELPPGYRLSDDTEGFAIAVPEGWERSQKREGVFYTSSDGTRLVQIFRVTEKNMTAEEAVRVASDDRRVHSEAYEEVRVGPVDGEGAGDAAELVYAYDSADAGGRRQVVERVFTASDERLYAVLVAGPADEWPDQEENLAVAVAHFDPYNDPF
ncbi:serine/arginine repetitive matrix protein 2 [Streptomyces sp. NBC_00846]|uniref:serine/arginine repetitive matrix protein 2 n=1 Tax=Streptomyces sp. NBC_00846 TaxID=2975849 RepID=UPI00386EB2E8|nr:serine/arginine repetitive matrix protein 2 [Streptomyces sp. NBC_00846]